MSFAKICATALLAALVVWAAPGLVGVAIALCALAVLIPLGGALFLGASALGGVLLVGVVAIVVIALLLGLAVAILHVLAPVLVVGALLWLIFKPKRQTLKS